MKDPIEHQLPEPWEAAADQGGGCFQLWRKMNQSVGTLLKKLPYIAYGNYLECVMIYDSPSHYISFRILVYQKVACQIASWMLAYFICNLDLRISHKHNSYVREIRTYTQTFTHRGGSRIFLGVGDFSSVVKKRRSRRNIFEL